MGDNTLADFGVCLMPEPKEREDLVELIKAFPLAAFQILNKEILNPEGYHISFGRLDEFTVFKEESDGPK